MTAEMLVSTREVRTIQVSIILQNNSNDAHPFVPKYVVVAGFGLMIYDWLVTIGDETGLIWHSRWNSTKFLFFATRYLEFIVSASALFYVFGLNLDAHVLFRKIGKDNTQFQSDIAVGAILVAEAIMALRVIALWRKSRNIFYSLGFLAVVYVIVSVITILKADHPVYGPLEGLPSCTIFHFNNRPASKIFALLMSFEFVIMVLTFWKGIIHWREDVYANALIVVFYRDGALYFLFLFALSMANFVIWHRERPETAIYYFLLVEPQRVFHSVLTARIILNLRETVARRQGLGSLPTIHFQCEHPGRAEGSAHDNSNEIEMNRIHTAVRSSRMSVSYLTDPQDRSYVNPVDPK
ncbi:hypothetical protein M0805_007874 [Coniferiporia weirii]|nr:hypothetical protein M0805_007874 [Coniferiporia weirii]